MEGGRATTRRRDSLAPACPPSLPESLRDKINCNASGNGGDLKYWRTRRTLHFCTDLLFLFLSKKFTKARQSCLGKKCKELKSPRRPVRKKGGLLSALLSFLSICPCYSCSQLGGDQTGCRKSRLGNALLLRAYNSYSVLNTSLCTRSTKKGGKREA